MRKLLVNIGTVLVLFLLVGIVKRMGLESSTSMFLYLGLGTMVLYVREIKEKIWKKLHVDMQGNKRYNVNMDGNKNKKMEDKKMTVSIKLDNGKIINRVVKQERCGNFVMQIVRYNNKEYLVGDGDEYIRGNTKSTLYKLGRCLA